jgi:hypothetical protein
MSHKFLMIMVFSLYWFFEKAFFDNCSKKFSAFSFLHFTAIISSPATRASSTFRCIIERIKLLQGKKDELINKFSFYILKGNLLLK